MKKQWAEEIRAFPGLVPGDGCVLKDCWSDEKRIRKTERSVKSENRWERPLRIAEATNILVRLFVAEYRCDVTILPEVHFAENLILGGDFLDDLLDLVSGLVLWMDLTPDVVHLP